MRLLIAMSAMAQAISIFAAVAAYQVYKLNQSRIVATASEPWTPAGKPTMRLPDAPKNP